MAVVPYTDLPEVVPAPSGSPDLVHSLADLWKMAEAFASSGYFKDASQVAQAFTKVMAGREMGLGPMQAMTQFHVVQGKPVMSAPLQAALVKRSGRYDFRVTEHSDDACEIAFFERGEEIGTSRFTMQDAQTADLLKNDTWRKYPRNMLHSRALTNGVRWYCPDVLGGAVYDPDELGGIEAAPAPAARAAAPRTLTPRAAAVVDSGTGATPAGRDQGGVVAGSDDPVPAATSTDAPDNDPGLAHITDWVNNIKPEAVGYLATLLKQAGEDFGTARTTKRPDIAERIYRRFGMEAATEEATVDLLDAAIKSHRAKNGDDDGNVQTEVDAAADAFAEKQGTIT